jgi:phospholipase/carboxylesterase
MINDRDPKSISIMGRTFMVKEPDRMSSETRIMLLLHGHLGNEKVMWVLTKPIPDNYILLAPRAPVKLGPDQYSWHEITSQWPTLNAYQDITDQLLGQVDQYVANKKLDINHYDLMGFSQGAVLAYALAILHPQKIGKVAALAGFLPQVWRDQLSDEIVKRKSFFIAHGNQDDIVPIDKARSAAEWLNQNGAQVTFCAADTGHKLSSNCFEGLRKFLA